MPRTTTLHQGDGMLLQLEEQAETVLEWISRHQRHSENCLYKAWEKKSVSLEPSGFLF